MPEKNAFSKRQIYWHRQVILLTVSSFPLNVTDNHQTFSKALLSIGDCHSHRKRFSLKPPSSTPSSNSDMRSVYQLTMSIVAFAVLILFPATFGAPHQHFSVEDFAEAFEKPPIHKFYLPIEIAPAALLGAFKAHARNSLHGSRSGSDSDAVPELPVDLIQQKRTTSSLEMVDPLSASAMAQEPPVFPDMKRKMFWQPLGYMPASARAQNSGGRSASGARNSQHDNGSNVFRYG